MTSNRLIVLFLGSVLSFQVNAAATIVIQNDDIANVGFNNTNAPGNAAQKGNNPGSTLGEMRMNVFLEAAQVWAGILNSNVTITVGASFEEKFCDANSATLGSAGATSTWSSFTGSEANIAYHVALAESLRKAELNGVTVEISTSFNSKLDTNDVDCLGGGGFYYGLDANVPTGTSALFPVVLHELGHGLGFSSISDVKPDGSGSFTGAGGHPDAYSRNLHDLEAGKSWDTMNNAERLASALNEPDLVWAGAQVTADRDMHLGAALELVVNAPVSITGSYDAVLGDEPTIVLPVNGVTGGLVDGTTAVELGSGDSADGCNQLDFATNFSGKIVIFDVPDPMVCSPVAPPLFSEIVGAMGVILVATEATGLPNVGGQISNQEITIPYIGVEKSVGDALRANLGTANVTIRLSPTKLTGENQGMVKMYAPSTFEDGSSVSHWSKTAAPNLLMEPSLGTLDFADVDLTAAAFSDIGWSVNIPGAVLEVIYRDGFEN